MGSKHTYMSYLYFTAEGNEMEDLLWDVDSFCILYIKETGGESVSSVFGQPAFTGKRVAHCFSRHVNSQLLH